MFNPNLGNASPYTAPRPGHGDMRRSTKGGAFWVRMGRLEMRLHEMYLRGDGERGSERISNLRKRVSEAFIKSARFRRMWLEAGWVKEFHATCKKARKRVSDSFATNFRLIIDILATSVFNHRKHCILRTPIPILDVHQQYSRDLTRTNPVKRYVAPPKVTDEDVTTFKRGRIPGVPAIASTTHDLAFARRLAAAKHRVRAHLLNAKRVTSRAGTSRPLRPIVTQSTRSCKPDMWKETRVDVGMTNRPSSTTVEFRDKDESAEDTTKRIRKLTKKWSDSDPVLYRVLYAWMRQNTTTMTKSMFARRQIEDVKTRAYAYLDTSAKRHVKTSTAELDVVDMTSKIMALIMIDPKTLVKLAANDVANDDASNEDAARAICTIQRVPVRPPTVPAGQKTALDTLREHMLPEVNLQHSHEDQSRCRILFPYIVEAVAAQFEKYRIYKPGLDKIYDHIEDGHLRYVRLLNDIAQALGVTAYTVCTMLAYTPIRMWGSFTSHTHGRTTDDPVSGRAMGGTRSAGCGGVMYLQKEPGRAIAPDRARSRFAHLVGRRQRGAPGNVRPAAPVQPRVSGMNDQRHHPSTQAPDVWRGLYNPFVDRRQHAYTCTLKLEAADGKPSHEDTLLFADDARAPAIRVVHTSAGNVRTEGARGYIMLLEQCVENLDGSSERSQILLKLLHKDYDTLRHTFGAVPGSASNNNRTNNNNNGGTNARNGTNNKGNNNGKSNKGNNNGTGNNNTRNGNHNGNNNKGNNDENPPQGNANNTNTQNPGRNEQTNPPKGLRGWPQRSVEDNVAVPAWTPGGACHDTRYAATFTLGPDAKYAYTATRHRSDMLNFAQLLATFDLTSLRKKQWLNDEVITQYGAIVNKSLASTGSAWQVLDALQASRLCHKAESWKKPPPYVRAKKPQWILPLNIDNDHWVAVHVDFTKKTIIVYDSLRGSKKHGALLGMLTRNLHVLVRDCQPNQWTFGLHAGLQQQGNGWDCGVYTCFVMRHLVRGWCMQFVDSRGQRLTSDVMRRRILKEIADGELLPPGASA